MTEGGVTPAPGHSRSTAASAVRASVLVTTTVLTALPAKLVMLEAWMPMAKATTMTAGSMPMSTTPTTPITAASMRMPTTGERSRRTSQCASMAPAKNDTRGVRWCHVPTKSWRAAAMPASTVLPVMLAAKTPPIVM